ncbi:hypothetical protein PAECIP111891_00959 [Paenibacillus allorhizoplanae]|uniref:Sporulation histidine kinase inhibitor Sda n=1 Tax=Paenibacillus allorhizoplanae TaxID=2905648 RepID=A0ABN8G1J3_9BACL|nr:hypothetical protein PAECIP111891_00959 [Paenibacillus allorhizoplanae]
MVLPEKLIELIKFGFYAEDADLFVHVHEDMLRDRMRF